MSTGVGGRNDGEIVVARPACCASSAEEHGGGGGGGVKLQGGQCTCHMCICQPNSDIFS